MRPPDLRFSPPAAHPVAAGDMQPSTSAQLRQTQQDLAASQTDLTRVECERDGVREELARQAAATEDLEATLAGTRARLAAVGKQNRDLLKENAALLAERDRLRDELTTAIEAHQHCPTNPEKE